jgi:5'-nucleotidase (lipoprotein e(P4) family)
MINLVFRLFILISVASIGSCSSTNKTNPQEKFKMATLYFQRAPEVKALYYQAYNGAKKYLDERLGQSKGKQCVVLDIDETVLDNSPYQGWLYQNNASYSSLTWENWVNKGIASAHPGVVDFIN